MKIAFVDEDLSPRTGSRRFTSEVTRELKKRGHEVGLFTTRLNKDTCFKAYLSLPCEVFSKRAPDSGRFLRRSFGNDQRTRDNLLFKVANNLSYCLSQADLAMDMSARMAEMDCDAVLAHYHGSHWFMPYFYYLRRPSGVVFLNVTEPLPRRREALPFQELPLYGEIVNKALRLLPVGRWEQISQEKIRMLMGPSRYLLKQAEKQGSLGGRKAEIVPLGVDHSEFYPTGEEEPFALYVGRIHPHKSLELAVMAMKGSATGQSLVIAGDITGQCLWYKEKLVHLAEKLKISDRLKIIVSPSDSEVVRLMQRCSVFLFPSTIDTFGLVVLEAMACGKPIVACNRGGPPEIVGDAGFLLEPDVDEWRKTVNRVFSDSKLRLQMHERSLQRSMVFSWEKTTDRLLSVLNLMH